MNGSDVKGFPIISADGAGTLGGYIGRTELRYVIGALFCIPSDKAIHSRRRTIPKQPRCDSPHAMHFSSTRG